jgi:hypothetical protein
MMRWSWVSAGAIAISCGGSTDDDVRLGGAGTSAGGTSAGGPSSGGIVGAGATGAGSGGVATGGVSGGSFPDGSSGGRIDPPGPPLCGGRECAPGQACCMTTGQCFDPASDPAACAAPSPDGDPQGRKPCASNAHCEANEFCMNAGSAICQSSGHCQPIGNCGYCAGEPGQCRVCGCDGNTYPDVQTACRAGARVLPYHGGGCGEAIDYGGGAAGNGTVPPLRVTPCGTDANCPSGQRCCAITALCYPPEEPGRCVPPPPGTRFPCTADDQCFPGSEFCSGEGCSGPGGCVERNREDCGVTLEPVCGCDGTTYTSAACASMRGVRVASQGACP